MVFSTIQNPVHACSFASQLIKTANLEEIVGTRCGRDIHNCEIIWRYYVDQQISGSVYKIKQLLYEIKRWVMTIKQAFNANLTYLFDQFLKT